MKPCFLQSNLRFSRALESPGGYSWEFLVGVCRPVLQILTRFQTKKCNFSDPFSDQTSKIHTSFQSWPLGRIYVVITYRIRAQTNKFIKKIQCTYFSFFLTHLELKRKIRSYTYIYRCYLLFIYLFIHFILFLLSPYLRFFADFIGDNQYCIVAHLE